MTPEQFLEWLDKEIDHCRQQRKEDPLNDALNLYQNTREQTWEEVKEKFLTLTSQH